MKIYFRGHLIKFATKFCGDYWFSTVGFLNYSLHFWIIPFTTFWIIPLTKILVARLLSRESFDYQVENLMSFNFPLDETDQEQDG